MEVAIHPSVNIHLLTNRNNDNNQNARRTSERHKKVIVTRGFAPIYTSCRTPSDLRTIVRLTVIKSRQVWPGNEPTRRFWGISALSLARRLLRAADCQAIRNHNGKLQKSYTARRLKSWKVNYWSLQEHTRVKIRITSRVQFSILMRVDLNARTERRLLLQTKPPWKLAMYAANWHCVIRK